MSEILDLFKEISGRVSKELDQDVLHGMNLKDYMFRSFNLIYPNFNASYKWP